MKGVIIYKGKYGATKQYAEWLGEELGFPVFTADNIDKDLLNLYDVFILGSSVYIGKLQIKKFLYNNIDLLRYKKIYFFQVAGSPPEEKEKRMQFNRSSIPSSLIDKCEFYYLPGRLNIEKLSWWDRFMLKMGARLAKTQEEKHAMTINYDQVKKEYLGPLIKSARSLNPEYAF